MTSVLMAAAEVSPFVKAGGLGDVLGALPAELRRNNVDVRVIMPKYKFIPAEYADKMVFLENIYVYLGWRKQYCGIYELDHKGYKVYFLDNEFYFGGDSIYYSEDADIERFAFFSMAVLSILPHIEFTPDVVHCHDWHTSLIPIAGHAHFKRIQFYSNIKFVMTIHNLRYQGICSRKRLYDLIGLNDGYSVAPHLYYNDAVNCFKGGLSIADAITTVSESYANEILYPYFGEGLESVLNGRKDALRGIVNGIDYDDFNPQTDPHIFENYNKRNFQSKKKANKLELQKMLDLEPDPSKLMVSVISRLVFQKGVDLITRIFDELLSTTDVQFVVLGTGEREYELFFSERVDYYKSRVAARIYFDEALARKIYAASDLFLMPSRFEPCGLSQMVAMRYGTLPVVREIGGLRDTVISCERSPENGTGFSFEAYNAHDMLYTIQRAIDGNSDKVARNAIIRRAMSVDFSWQSSAKKYIQLYDSLK